MKNTLQILAALLTSAVVSLQAKDASRPNIVFIVADDMGYADCGVHGGRDIPTPNLDALAASGVRFTDGYVTGAVCSPTRAALMTGRYHLRDGVSDWIRPGAQGMNTNVPTVAQYLQRTGYKTSLVGKWHLGEADSCHPMSRGFDEFYGFLGGGRSYWPNAAAGQPGQDKYGRILRGHEPVVETEYLTIAFGREAVGFIQRQKANSQPFFLYLAFNAVHTPMEAPRQYMERFASISDKGRRTYAAMLAVMDEEIGKVIQAICDAGLEKNTLVCFISDNGGPVTRNAPNHSSNTPLRGGKGETWEGGIRVPFFVKWPARLKPGTLYTKPVMQTDISATAIVAAGATPNPAWPMDGVDLMPFLVGKRRKAVPHDLLCWEHLDQWAIRQGSWKLTFALPTRDASEPVLGLFDLSRDKEETQNLLEAKPEKAGEMKLLWEEWRRSLASK